MWHSLDRPASPSSLLLLPQKCADAAFCTRLRGNTSEAFAIVSESVAVEGARVTATVKNTEDANGTFSLVLTGYGDTLRLFVDESPNKGRFQVPDVLLPGLEQREQVRTADCRRLVLLSCSCKCSFCDSQRDGWVQHDGSFSCSRYSAVHVCGQQ